MCVIVVRTIYVALSLLYTRVIVVRTIYVALSLLYTRVIVVRTIYVALSLLYTHVIVVRTIYVTLSLLYTCVIFVVLQDGVKAANGGTQQAIQLVVHRIYEKLVAALAEREDGVDSGRASMLVTLLLH